LKKEELKRLDLGLLFDNFSSWFDTYNTITIFPISWFLEIKKRHDFGLFLTF